jgi:ABC-type multidrug transport system ATPase subunit
MWIPLGSHLTLAPKVLGPPGAGKSTFLKAVAGRLKIRKNQELDGHVYYNGKRLEDKTKFHIENAISFIDQLDRHAPRLTVDETFEFAYQCKKGGTHINFKFVENTKEAREAQRKADAERVLVNTNLESLGLEHVRDTFVGDDDVRGVSGGQRRRVTVGEMLMDSSPILCADEISNGLDASSTYEMIQILMHIGRIQRRTRVISLLQPSPETVSLFDEVILLAEGHLLYAGPISQVEDYFLDLGYRAPDHMDIADFLQLLSTPDGETFFVPQENGPDARLEPYSVAELAELFRKSPFGKVISEGMEAPYQYVWSSARDVHHIEEAVDHLNDHRFQHRYENSFIRSVYLNLKRNLTIWKRDKRVLIANAVKNAIMGISVGGVFFQTEDVISILGVLFQGMLFIMLGGMTNAPAFVGERNIYYKHADANFFSAYPFVVGKAISKIPQVS